MHVRKKGLVALRSCITCCLLDVKLFPVLMNVWWFVPKRLKKKMLGFMLHVGYEVFSLHW